MSKKFMIQIPDSIIKNGEDLNANDFVLYTYLKFKDEIDIKEDEHVIIAISQLKYVLDITDNRTLRDSLLKLKKLNLIDYDEDTYTLSTVFKIKMLNNIKSKSFTQLPYTIFEKIKVIKPIGIRILYYYESHINRKNKNLTAYPSFQSIINDLNINTSTLIKYNNLLVENNLLSVFKSKININEYSGFGIKSNNKYTIKIDNI